MNTPFSPPTEPEKPKRRWGLLTLILSVSVLPVLLAGMWFLSYRMSGVSAVERLEARVKERGEPVSLADLAAMYPPIPDESNGAIALLNIWEEESPDFWRAFREGKSSLPNRAEHRWDDALPFLGSDLGQVPRTGALAATNLAAAKQFLEERKDHLAAVRQALQFSKFRFPVVITNGFAALLPHLSEIRREAQNIRIEILVATERGDADTSINGMEDVARMGNTLASEPFLISQLVRNACFSMVLDDLERLLSQHALSAAQLDRVDRLLKQLQTPGALRLTLVTERAAEISAFNHPEEVLRGFQSASPNDPETPSAAARGVGLGLWKAFGLKDADERLLLETMEEMITLADREGPEALQRHEQLIRDAGVKARRFPPKLLSALMLPALARVPARFAAFEARRRAATVALAVERYRQAHDGHLPADLAELTPQLPPDVLRDPFDNGPLRLKPLPAGFEVYSLGPNRVDDGGTERSRKGYGVQNYDVTFFVER